MRLRLGLARASAKGWSLQFAELPGKPDFYFLSSKVAEL